MATQKSISPLDRTSLKASFLQKLPNPKSLSFKARFPSFPKSSPSYYSPLSNFYASKPGVLILEFWIKRVLRNLPKLIIASLVYISLVILISKDNAVSSQNDLTYITDVLNIAGNFSETIDDGYLFEEIPIAFQDAGSDLRSFYREHVRGKLGSNDPFRKSVVGLFRELEEIGEDWWGFVEERDNAILNVKKSVESSRHIFQKEYENLGGSKKGKEEERTWRRTWKKLMLDDPYESHAHFSERNFKNITDGIQNQIFTWRTATIPDLIYKLTLTETKTGPFASLPGKIKEVEEKWPKWVWGDSKYRKAPTGELEVTRAFEDVIGKAISLLMRAEGIYGDYWYAIQLLDEVGRDRVRGGFGAEHLEVLLGVFDRVVGRLEDAEGRIGERRYSWE